MILDVSNLRRVELKQTSDNRYKTPRKGESFLWLRAWSAEINGVTVAHIYKKMVDKEPYYWIQFINFKTEEFQFYYKDGKFQKDVWFDDSDYKGFKSLDETMQAFKKLLIRNLNEILCPPRNK